MPTLAIDRGEIHYEAAGTGRPVVLLHSGGGSARQWNRLLAKMSDRFALYAPDFPGHGASPPAASDPGPSLEQDATIVDAMADRAGRPFHLIGHSHGGAVAVTYARRRPRDVTSLVLIEPTLMHLLRIAGSPEAWHEAHELGTMHIAAVAAGECARIADEFLPYWIGAAAWAAIAAPRRAAIVATMPAVARFWQAVFAETTPLESYAALHVPTLLLLGERTRATTREIVRLLGDVVPGARTLVIPGAGHMAPVTHADAVNAAIHAHLTANSRP